MQEERDLRVRFALIRTDGSSRELVGGKLERVLGSAVVVEKAGVDCDGETRLGKHA